MAALKSECVQETKTSFLSRGSDLLTMKIWKLISSKNRHECWYLQDFRERLKENPQKIRKVLANLEKEGYIKKIKTYPVFWEINNG